MLNISVSIAMTTYNSERFLLEQLQSIRQQSRPADEVVIVDDASTDRTVSMINDFIQMYNITNWQLIIHNENQGYINSFRHALSEVSGDIIFLCDHDDIWLPEKINIMLRCLTNNPKILMLAASFTPIDADGKKMLRKNIPFTSNNSIIKRRIPDNKCVRYGWRDEVTYNVTPGCSTALLRSIRDTYLSTSQYRHLPHDFAMSILASLHDGLYFLNTPLIRYRIHEGNVTGFKSAIYSEKRYCIQKEVVEMIEQIELPDRKKEKVLHYTKHLTLFFNLLYHCVYSPNRTAKGRIKLLLMSMQIRGVLRTFLFKKYIARC